MTAIDIAGLSFAYPPRIDNDKPVSALHSIDLQVDHGEFVALMGPVGAGKSTLCFALNGAIPHAIDGKFQGTVTVCGQNTRETSMGQLAMRIGLVFENAETQLFNASIADEVAFGLEAMGLPADQIEIRIKASLDLVGLSLPLHRSPRMLSGGEQKRLALASVLAMRPQVLILDEPTAGLDPRARQTVLSTIDRLRQAGNMTVVMATQDTEAAARFADRIVVMQAGKIALSGSPDRVFFQIEQLDKWGIGVPQLARLAHSLTEHKQRTFDFLHLSEARAALEQELQNKPFALQAGRPSSPSSPPGKALIQIRDLDYRYPSTEQPALQNVSMDVLDGEWLAVIGINGSGKSTLIKHLNGLLKPWHGTVHVNGQDTRERQVGELARIVSYLPQNPDQLLFSASVHDEVAYGPRQLGLRARDLDERVTETLASLDLTLYAEHPPAVLGYGLRRQIALASALAMDTPVLALDEPAVGLDHRAIESLIEILSQRHRHEQTIVMITHDMQFVARCAQRVIVLHQGNLVCQGTPQQVLADVEILRGAGLEPLPVTDLAHQMGWPAPLPIYVDDFVRGIQ